VPVRRRFANSETISSYCTPSPLPITLFGFVPIDPDQAQMGEALDQQHRSNQLDQVMSKTNLLLPSATSRDIHVRLNRRGPDRFTKKAVGAYESKYNKSYAARYKQIHINKVLGGSERKHER
jgi:hypothetical protein